MRATEHYGSAPGQLGAMPAGSVDAVVGSPPFHGVTPTQGDPDYSWKFHGDQSQYGASAGQLAAMPSGASPLPQGERPPYAYERAGEEVWYGCYNESWKALLVDEAFSHPAKAAHGLLKRIFDELFKAGTLKKGDLVLDPFAGIGTTGLVAASRGCRFVGVELEPHFVALAEQNFAMRQRDYKAMGYASPVVVQGDSRRLREVLDSRTTTA